jgi:predicted Zn finger-like uncharacterized protein
MTADLVPPKPEEFLDQQSPGEEAYDQSNANLAELVCPDCGAKCLVDPWLFDIGESQAQCSACQGELIIIKDPGGSLFVNSLSKPVREKQFDNYRHVVCPKCLGRYRVSAKKLDKMGTWVKCPTCAERFIVKLDKKELLDDAPPEKAVTHFSRKARSVVSATSIVSITALELEVSVLDPVTAASKRYWGLGILGVLMLVFAVEAFVLKTSFSSAKNMGTIEEIQINAPAAYTVDSLVSDLKILQRNSIVQHTQKAQISHTGSESRIFKYAVEKLAPNTCTRITALAMETRSSAEGLSLTATCFDSRERSASLEVVWNGRYAMLYLTGQDRINNNLNVMIHK